MSDYVCVIPSFTVSDVKEAFDKAKECCSLERSYSGGYYVMSSGNPSIVTGIADPIFTELELQSPYGKKAHFVNIETFSPSDAEQVTVLFIYLGSYATEKEINKVATFKHLAVNLILVVSQKAKKKHQKLIENHFDCTL